MEENVAPSLLVDLYELAMVEAYRREGMAGRAATFSLFVRGLPEERNYLVAAGLDDVLAWLEELRFDAEARAAVGRLGVFPDEFVEWLGGLRFTGSVRAVPEGTIVFGHEPILEVDAPIAEAQLAETFLLNQITLQTVRATKAARCLHAAGGRAVVDFALRRTPGIDAGMKVTRVSRLVGLDGTSNVAGADRYGIPASGTMAHAFVQAYEDETEAFRAFVRAFGDETVLLVDTYDTRTGIERAIEVAAEARSRGVEIRAIRLDSGDLAELARHCRGRLDGAGFPHVRIMASGGLDEHEIHRLLAAGAPIDGFGVGSTLGASDDAPTLDTVYKLVSYDGRPVHKTSPGKANWPGAKQVWRAPGWANDTITLADEPAPGPAHTPLLVEVMHAGERTPAGRRTLAESHEHFRKEWAALPDEIRRLDNPTPHLVDISPHLRHLAHQIDAARLNS